MLKIVLITGLVSLVVWIITNAVRSANRDALWKRCITEILRRLERGGVCNVKLHDHVSFKYPKLTWRKFCDMLRLLESFNYVVTGNGTDYSITSMGSSALAYIDEGKPESVFGPLRTTEAEISAMDMDGDEDVTPVRG